MNKIDKAKKELREKFEKLYNKWQRDTGLHSFYHTIMPHEDCQAIIAMGDSAVPLLLEKLEGGRAGMGVIWALQAITKEDHGREFTIHEDGFAKTDVRSTINAWVKWGKRQGLI
jgi:hypothetical protein